MYLRGLRCLSMNWRLVECAWRHWKGVHVGTKTLSCRYRIRRSGCGRSCSLSIDGCGWKSKRMRRQWSEWSRKASWCGQRSSWREQVYKTKSLHHANNNQSKDLGVINTWVSHTRYNKGWKKTILTKSVYDFFVYFCVRITAPGNILTFFFPGCRFPNNKKYNRYNLRCICNEMDWASSYIRDVDQLKKIKVFVIANLPSLGNTGVKRMALSLS